MRIESSHIALNSHGSRRVEESRRESLRVWVGDRRPGEPAPLPQAAGPKAGVAQPPAAGAAQPIEPQLTPQDRMKMLILKAMIKQLTGKDIELTPLQLHDPSTVSVEITQPQPATAGAPERAGWGIEYDSRETYNESERMLFSAEGIVTTDDGRRLPVSITLAMSRDFMVERNLTIREGDAKKVDPLVINFDGRGVRLEDSRFGFDLNNDGAEERIAFVGEGSAFLALDKNGDGSINNGGELFGPSSGNGFSELKAYDDDGNGWIDSGDPVFEKLRLWLGAPAGEPALIPLAEKRVGALYLGSVGAGFGLKTADNRELGEAKSAGIYLDDKGAPGIVQQIDLTV